MLEGVYSNAAAMSAFQRWQETIAQNLAFAAVSGYKRAQFSLDGVTGRGAQLNHSAEGGFNIGTMPRASSQVNMTAGNVSPSSKSSDLAIDGPGFFRLQNRDGSTVYTRNGEFVLNADNQVVNKHGAALQGEGGPIEIDPEEGPITVSQDGTISQAGDEIARIPLYDFEDPSQLVPSQSGFLAGGAANPTLVQEPSIIQGALEASNVIPMMEMMGMVTIANAYQASQKVMSTSDQVAQQAIQTLGAPPPQAA